LTSRGHQCTIATRRNHARLEARVCRSEPKRLPLSFANHLARPGRPK
jgi:hypothetical protein